jgi:hypothetical protein
LPPYGCEHAGSIDPNPTRSIAAVAALLFLFFHKRLCGPLANSRFRHRPDPKHPPHSRLELAYHRADEAIQNVVDLLAAA